MDAVCIVGWGVDPGKVSAEVGGLLPGVASFVRPTSTAVLDAVSADLVVAWSYGAFLMVEAAFRGVQFRGRVVLYAPFVGFCAEDGLGGRCARTQIHWLKRWLRKDAGAALSDFAKRAGIPQEWVPAEKPVDELVEGLDRMSLGIRAAGGASPHFDLPKRWSAVIGGRDLLLDAQRVAQSIPGTRIVPEAGHSLAELLRCSDAI